RLPAVPGGGRLAPVGDALTARRVRNQLEPLVWPFRSGVARGKRSWLTALAACSLFGRKASYRQGYQPGQGVHLHRPRRSQALYCPMLQLPGNQQPAFSTKEKFVLG